MCQRVAAHACSAHSSHTSLRACPWCPLQQVLAVSSWQWARSEAESWWWTCAVTQPALYTRWVGTPVGLPACLVSGGTPVGLPVWLVSGGMHTGCCRTRRITCQWTCASSSAELHHRTCCPPQASAMYGQSQQCACRAATPMLFMPSTLRNVAAVVCGMGCAFVLLHIAT
jgi:hypothetical protein